MPYAHSSCCRGFTAAVLSQPAAGIEQRHPRLVRAAAAPLSALLHAQPIAQRSAEVRLTHDFGLPRSRHICW
jgi:hypothetical protein